MNKYKIYIIIVFSCLLTGCYNYREINNLAITSAVAIDKIDDEFEITVQVINTKKMVIIVTLIVLFQQLLILLKEKLCRKF